MKEEKIGEEEDKNTGVASSITEDSDYIKFKSLYAKLKERYGAAFEDYVGEEQLLIPCTVFSKKLSSLQAITKYLVENLEIGLRDIGKILGRSDQGIWQAYNQSKKKVSEKIKPGVTRYWIPARVVADKRLSVLESIVRYLKDEYSLNYHKIALVIKRDDRTVWTIYKRAMRKQKLSEASNDSESKEKSKND